MIFMHAFIKLIYMRNVQSASQNSNKYIIKSHRNTFCTRLYLRVCLNTHWVMNSTEKAIMKFQLANNIFSITWIQTCCKNQSESRRSMTSFLIHHHNEHSVKYLLFIRCIYILCYYATLCNCLLCLLCYSCLWCSQQIPVRSINVSYLLS